MENALCTNMSNCKKIIIIDKKIAFKLFMYVIDMLCHKISKKKQVLHISIEYRFKSPYHVLKKELKVKKSKFPVY